MRITTLYFILLLIACLIGISITPTYAQEHSLQQEQITEIVRSGDGQILAVNYYTVIVDLVDANTGELLQSVNLPRNPRTITLNPTGDRFVWTDGMSMYLYDVPTSTNFVLSQGGEGSRIEMIAWNPINNFLAITSGTILNVYDLSYDSFSEEASEAGFTVISNASGIVDIEWSPDGQRISTSHYSQNALDPSIENFTVQIWDVVPGTEQTTPLVRYDNRGGGSIAWSPDGTQLALIVSNNLTIYDTITDAFIAELTFEEQYPATVVWSPTGDYVATGGETIRIWDTETWEMVGTLSADPHAQALQWSPDGQYLFSDRTSVGLSMDEVADFVVTSPSD